MSPPALLAHKRNEDWPSLDIVIPVYNEEAVLPHLFAELKRVFSPLALEEHHLSSIRLLFIDDGSRDQTAHLIQDEIQKGLPAILLRLSRNFGHANALTAGYERAEADIIGAIDADLQDPPEALLGMVSLWRKGYDVVYGVRRKRKEPFFKVACYWLFYRLLNFLSDDYIPMDSGDFCLMDKRVVNILCSLPERLRFPRGLRSWIGFSQVGFEYERHARAKGESKYNFRKLYELATDGIVSTTTRPLKVTQYFSSFFLVLLTGLTLFLLTRLSAGYPHPANNAVHVGFLIAYILISITGLMIMFALHILCGYIGRAYLEIKRRPSYLVMETVGECKHPRAATETAQRRPTLPIDRLAVHSA